MPHRLRINAAAIIDGDDVCASPGAILFETPDEPDAGRPLGGAVLAAGSAAEVDAHPASGGAPRLDLADAIVTPAFVNAHCHLDLTSIGPRPIDAAGGFAAWAAMVRSSRPGSAAARIRAVEEGIDLSLRGGVVAVGDIAGAGTREPLEVLRRSPLIGTCFIEFFGLASRQDSAAEAMERLVSEISGFEGGVRLGLQPHASYSAGLRVYEGAAALQQWGGVPLTTHLAETLEERQFVREGTGPLRAMLESFGLWDEQILREIGQGRSPAQHLARPLRHARWLLAHCNDLRDEDVGILAESGASVVFCPRAHRSFGHARTLGEHRWRELVERGVPVALGTDSIVSLPPDSAGRLSPIDDAALLSETVPAREALRMITIHAARALDLPAEWFTLKPGASAGIAMLRPSRVGMRGDGEGALRAALREGCEVELVRPERAA